jgi:hypothetical protein
MGMMVDTQQQHTSFGKQDIQECLAFVMWWDSTLTSSYSGEVLLRFRALL